MQQTIPKQIAYRRRRFPQGERLLLFYAPDTRVLLFRIRFVFFAVGTLSFAVRLRQGSALFAPPGPALCGGLSRGPPAQTRILR